MTKKESRELTGATVTKQAAPDIGAPLVAPVLALSPDGHVVIGLDGARVPARLAVATTRERLETAALLQQQAVVVCEGGDRRRPIIIGLIETLPPHVPDAAVAAVSGAQPQVTMPEGRTETLSPVPTIDADVDGKRVRVTAIDELVLQCGSASITLRRNGRVVVRGTYVESHSDGTNRLKGGQVLIN